MRVQGFTTGVFQANAFIVASREGSDAVLVDPGQDAAEPLIDAVSRAGLTVRSILLTHGHIDHVWEAAVVAQRFDVSCFIHPADRYMLADPAAAIGAAAANAGWALEIPADLRDLADGDRFAVGDATLTARHAPGHTPGHCIFVTDGLVISGDLIFMGSVGRTDFPRGSTPELLDSIRRLILTLPDDTVIISGHGPETSVGRERATNPFITGLHAPAATRRTGL